VIVGFLSMAAVILLALLRVPLGIALMSVSLAGLSYITSTTTALTLFPMTVSEAVLSYDLAIVPMFILMGNIISRTGMAQDLFRAANAYLGSVRGGLSLATMVTCAGFGAVCG
jgi:TRAP-type mannitol/chloroaromatic compound transport system permease large subunit